MRSRIVMVSVCALLGGAERAAGEGVHVSVAGTPVALDDAEALVDLAARWGSEPIAVSLGGRLLERSRAELGGRVDVARLRAWLAAAADPSSPMRGHLEGTRLELRLPVELELEVAEAWLLERKAELDRDAQDARLDPETGEVLPEQEGRELDVWATLDRLDAAFREGAEVVELVVHRTAPTRRADELRSVDLSALMGHFETPYDGSGRSADRTHNLRVAASKVDGVVLMPGEVFDFNGVVGERSLAGGFRPATVIAGGELVDGVGGGACQIAGTLHAAAFFAGLRILERHPHSRPSSYIKLGLDAAVSYPTLNLRFRNDRAFPIQLRVVVAGGQTRAEIRGAAHPYEVSFLRRIDDFRAYEERSVEDPELPEGVRVLSQRGVPGFSLTRFRILRDPQQNTATRERSEDTYPPTTQVWRVGTGGTAPEGYEAPAGDQHGEYRADGYMVVRQGVGVEGTEVVRRALHTGSPGWTLREGMPPVD